MIGAILFLISVSIIFVITLLPLKKCCDWFYTPKQGYRVACLTLIAGILGALVSSVAVIQLSLHFGKFGPLNFLLQVIVSFLVVVIIYSRLLQCRLTKAFVIAIVSGLLTAAAFVILTIFFSLLAFLTGKDLPYLRDYDRGPTQMKIAIVQAPEPVEPTQIGKLSVFPVKEETQKPNQALLSMISIPFEAVDAHVGDDAVITLMNGETQEGTLQGILENKLVLHQQTKPIHIPKEEIKSIVIFKN